MGEPQRNGVDQRCTGDVAYFSQFIRHLDEDLPLQRALSGGGTKRGGPKMHRGSGIFLSLYQAFGRRSPTPEDGGMAWVR